MVEEDFACAELELVPATAPIDIGFDRGLIGAYGQDDKICVYASLMAFTEVNNPQHTAVAMFVDKEEIGSTGDTGAASFILQNFAVEYLKLTTLGISVNALLEHANAISADVTAGVDPNFKDVNDHMNASTLGKGVSVEKYGGGGGKYSTHDSTAEYMQYMRALLEKHNICWQTGELGRIDLGGGGTIGMYMSRYGMNCVDAGPCVLGMHSPCEVSSKADLYSAYLLYKAFFKE
jgi:aspartyl aminopeptidase